LMLIAGADINAGGSNAATATIPGGTALMSAAKSGHLERGRQLLSAGADVNAEDKLDQTALDKASFRYDHEMIALLKEHGAQHGGSYWERQRMEAEALREAREKRRELESQRERFSGGFGEPYCSHECFDKGGSYASSVMLQNLSGVCGFCQKPVKASMYGVSECGAIPYEGVTLFVCLSFAEMAKSHLNTNPKCCMCQKMI